jgi:hypothetical protein
MKLNPISLAVGLLLVAAPASRALTRGGDGSGTDVTLRASVPMASTVNTGDRVAFEYQTRDDAAVIVFNIDSRGYVHLLAPSGPLEMTRANTRYVIPEPGSDLVVDSQTGVEFAFAVAVTDPSAVDASELEHLRASDTPGHAPYRISGDPFVAANMIAGELVRGISRRGATFAYTLFYVNDRVDAPCYLCGGCDGEPVESSCDGYRIVQNFDRRSPLDYPLRRGYDMVETAAAMADESLDDDSDVVVNFYPYGSQVRYVDPVPAYSVAWGFYDPFLWYWPGYYPYCPTGWGFSVGWGWGWGWDWGYGRGYYCSGWYSSRWYDGYRGDGRYRNPQRFKSARGSGSSGLLVSNRTVAQQRDASLRIASKGVRASTTARPGKPASIATRARTGTRSPHMSTRSKTTGPRVHTRVSGAPTRGKPATLPHRTLTGTARGRVGSGSTHWTPPVRLRAKSSGAGTSSRGRIDRGGTVRTKAPSWGSPHRTSDHRSWSPGTRSRSFRSPSPMRGGTAKSAPPRASSRDRRR